MTLNELKNKKIYAATPNSSFIVNKKKIYVLSKKREIRINLNFIYTL